MSNKIGQPKSILGSFYTHDDRSPMLYGGAPWVSFVTALQGMIPQCCPYTTDGMPTGDLYIFPYDHAQVRDSETDCHECTVHTGRMDIFNKSRKPGGKSPEISEMMKASNAIRNGNYNEIIKPAEDKKLKMGAFAKDVITKGSFITLPSNNDEVISFARHKDGKTLIFIGNRNVNRKVGARIEIPGLKPEQKFNNLLPSQNNIQGRIQNNKDGSITVELDANKACVFEIDDANIQKLSKPENILQQKYLN